jgi:hypothetical protein
MGAAATTIPMDSAWRPSVNPWIIALVVTLATFMEVLDTSVANVALPHIAGGLSAGQDESTAHERMVFRTDRAQAFLHVLRRPLHDQFVPLRSRA